MSHPTHLRDKNILFVLEKYYKKNNYTHNENVLSHHIQISRMKNKNLQTLVESKKVESKMSKEKNVETKMSETEVDACEENKKISSRIRRVGGDGELQLLSPSSSPSSPPSPSLTLALTHHLPSLTTYLHSHHQNHAIMTSLSNVFQNNLSSNILLFIFLKILHISTFDIFTFDLFPFDIFSRRHFIFRHFSFDIFSFDQSLNYQK
jgi:hypothetical protein